MNVKSVTLDSNRTRNSNIPREYHINPGQTIDYEVDYEEEAKQLMRITRDELVRKHDFLNITFEKGEAILKSKFIQF